MKYTVITKQLPNALELQRLFRQTSWANARSIEEIELLLQNTTTYVVIRDNDQLIGFGRAISDGVYRAMLDDIVVDEDYRKKGVGKFIVKKLLDVLDGVEQVFLNTKPDLESYYEALGFSKTKGVTMHL
ncbi:GNAT family N-acetyltransferase [Aquimarina sp. 2304DJ70-9]|uniref:GNAT family N-acetyltransferase n=1 Tax=Aquimarina penaris TaxID=3231044 RepID=UPI0034629A38